MSVKTKNELDRAKLEKNETQKKKDPVVEDGKKIRFCAMLKGFKGNGTTTIRISEFKTSKKTEEAKILKVELQEGIYYFPQNIGQHKAAHYMKAFTAAGFIDVSYIDQPTEKKEVLENFEFTLAHPENGPTPDSKMRGGYSVKIGEKNIPLEIIDGLITTKDKSVYEELVRNGWIERKRVPLKEDK